MRRVTPAKDPTAWIPSGAMVCAVWERVPLQKDTQKGPHGMSEYEVAERAGDAVVLRLLGEWREDLPVDRIHDDLQEHYVDDGVRVIRADLSGVEFMSLEGVAALLDLRQEAQRRGKTFLVEHPAGQVQDKLVATGVLRLLASED